LSFHEGVGVGALTIEESESESESEVLYTNSTALVPYLLFIFAMDDGEVRNVLIVLLPKFFRQTELYI
jgi:hypothetical protein